MLMNTNFPSPTAQRLMNPLVSVLYARVIEIPVFTPPAPFSLGKPRETLGGATDIVEDMAHRQHSMAHLNEDPSLATAGRFLTLTCGFLALNKRNKLKASSFYE
ncbi:unnamed protein product [Boreogadus saida]